MFTLSEGVHDKREVEEAEEECIELVKPGEDLPEGFQAAEQPLDLVTFPVQPLVVGPGSTPMAFRGDYGGESSLPSQLAGGVQTVSGARVLGCGNFHPATLPRLAPVV